MAGLKPAGDELRGVGAGLKPVTEELLDRNLDGLLDFVVNWALSTNGEDGLSHYFRGLGVGTPITGRDMVQGTLTPRGLEEPLEIPTNEFTGNEPPTAPLPAGAPAAEPVPADPSSVTGLDEQQEQQMLGQLLGGGS